MPIPYDQWWETVGNHLDKIGAGAEMCSRHAAALPCRPNFRTLAESDLKRCETVLRRSLIEVRRAQAVYRWKLTEDEIPSSQ